jgi:CRISPR-associated exonuclease Cas4
MMDNYLPLAYLNAFEYCPRRFYFEYVLGEMAENEHIVIGRHLHRNIDEPTQLQEGDKIIYQQQWVWSDRLAVKGIIDAVEKVGDELVPIEYKKGRMAKHINDHLQLCAAGICIEERLDKIIDHGEIFYHGNRRRQRVEFTPALRQLTEETIKLAHLAVYQPIPLPINNPKKCRDCSIQGICLSEEIKYLKQCPAV